MRHLSAAALTACIAFLSACSDSAAPPPSVGALALIAIRSGNSQSALAGTPLPTPVIVVPTDDQNLTVLNQTATFSVIAGGGAIPSTAGTANSDGSITAPTWTLGTSALPQQLQVTIGSKSTVISAAVSTSYKIDVRFFGRTLTAAQAALFTNAAARIRAIVVGQLPLVNATGADPSSCGATGVGVLAETIDGVVIYASIDSIDGKGKILAESGPCYIRTSAAGPDYRTSIGIMKFDSADINSLDVNGNLQEVITHEMMHVVGFGSFWDSTAKNLLINDSTPLTSSTAAYIGAGGIAGCKALGAVMTCASSVPVEGIRGGAGTLYSHWRESTFGNELMTGFLNTGTNPLSVMTIRSLEDLNYTVNPAAADPYTLPAGVSLRAAFRADDISATPTPGVWERPLPRAPRGLPTVGVIQNLRSN
jgi:Leishmanolysin